MLRIAAIRLMLMNSARAVSLAACTVVASCSLTDSNAPSLVRTSIVLASSQRTGLARPPGPFASVLDSVVLVIKSTNGDLLATSGYKLRAYDSTASMEIDIPTGDALFDVQVLSSNRSIVFKGNTLATVTDDDTPIVIDVEPVRPVMLVLPDTARTTAILNSSFTIYNAGSSALSISVVPRDARCVTACTITFTSAPVAPGATSIVRVVVPQNFPPGLLSFLVRSAEGDVPVFWQFTSLQIP